MEPLQQSQPLSDLELLTALCTSQDDDIFYVEFVERFLPEIETECIKICKQRKLDLHVGKEIAHDVFEKLRKYKSFESDAVTAISSHTGILVYLYRIAKNLFNDWHNKAKKNRNSYVNKTYFDELFSRVIMPDTGDLLQWKRDTSLTILKKLNPKEQKVILTDIDHKKHSLYLPDEINEDLAQCLGVKKDSIRKIRERAITKIKIAIDEINKQ
ncbi:MAG: sigma-70 family RNA polymerase sigma factor [Ferruginibacter sp.]